MDSFIAKLLGHQDGAMHQRGATCLMYITQTTMIGAVPLFMQPNLTNVVVKGNGPPNLGGTLGANNEVGLGQPIEVEKTTHCVELEHISKVQMLFLNL